MFLYSVSYLTFFLLLLCISTAGAGLYVSIYIFLRTKESEKFSLFEKMKENFLLWCSKGNFSFLRKTFVKFPQSTSDMVTGGQYADFSLSIVSPCSPQLPPALSLSSIVDYIIKEMHFTTKYGMAGSG